LSEDVLMLSVALAFLLDTIFEFLLLLEVSLASFGASRGVDGLDLLGSDVSRNPTHFNFLLDLGPLGLLFLLDVLDLLKAGLLLDLDARIVFDELDVFVVSLILLEGPLCLTLLAFGSLGCSSLSHLSLNFLVVGDEAIILNKNFEFSGKRLSLTISESYSSESWLSEFSSCSSLVTF
jgi:hypothetical protein